MKEQDKVRDDIGPEDFGIPAEFAERARNYAAFALSHAAGQEVVAGEFSDWFATWAAHKGLTMHKTADGRYLCPNTSLAEDAYSAGCMTEAIYYMELCRQDELNSPAVARSEAAPPTTSAEVGQDGEQCRAASGFDLVAAMESWRGALDSAKELAANAPDERYRTRASDVVAYLMTRAPNADSALSRGVPEVK